MKKNLWVATAVYVVSSLLFSISAYSQFLISSSGNSVHKGNLSVSWSLGDIAIQTLKSGDLILTQGFHQSKISTTSVFITNTSLNVNVFPNPASEIINIKVDNPDGLSYSIYNSLGASIEIKPMNSNQTKIPVQTLNSGIYYLNIYKNDSLIATYKISVIK